MPIFPHFIGGPSLGLDNQKIVNGRGLCRVAGGHGDPSSRGSLGL